MDIFSNIFPSLGEFGHIMFNFFKYGGEVLVFFLIFTILYLRYMAEIEHQFIHSQEWLLLSIKVPKENLVSTLAVESMFAQMHALHSSINFPQKYIEGRTQLWYSLEIISLGGKISFIIRTPKKTKDLVEASVYAQYPNAEIEEIADYMEHITYEPETSDFNIWGSEFKLTDDDVLPLKTWKDFEHPSAEEKIIDPLATQYEALNKIAPHEFYGIQMIIQPLADEEWKPRAEAKVKKLIGEEAEHSTSFVDIVMTPINAFANFSFKDSLTGGGHGGHGDENKPKNNWTTMTEAEKERVSLVEKKMGKPGYKTKIRHLYIAPKEKFDGQKKSIVIGTYRPLGSAMSNKLKPDTKRTWTGVEYTISPTLERGMINREENRRKRNIFKGYKERDIHLGNPMFVLNIEELATMFHFPITSTTTAASIEKTESKKSQAPINLPVVVDY